MPNGEETMHQKNRSEITSETTNNVLVSLLDALVKLCEAYYEKVNQLEGEKYDMEKEVELKDYRVRCNQSQRSHIFQWGDIFMKENIFVWFNFLVIALNCILHLLPACIYLGHDSIWEVPSNQSICHFVCNADFYFFSFYFLFIFCFHTSTVFS